MRSLEGFRSLVRSSVRRGGRPYGSPFLLSPGTTDHPASQIRAFSLYLVIVLNVLAPPERVCRDFEP